MGVKVSESVCIEEIKGITDEEILSIAEELGEEHDSYLNYLDDIGENGWYLAREDLVKWSKKHPNRLIEVHLFTYDKYWVDFIQNGSWYREKAKIVYPNFNSKKLV